MNWRPIILSAALLAGCETPRGGKDAAPLGDILKLSYFRAYSGEKNPRLEATYRVVMSNSWKEYVGEGPKEPLIKAGRGRIYAGYLPDREVRKYLEYLGKLGIDQLVSSDPDELNPVEFRRMALDPKETSFTRVFTIGTDTWAKSYYYRDQQQSTDLIKIFVTCEKFVVLAVENSLQVRTGARSLSSPEDK